MIDKTRGKKFPRVLARRKRGISGTTCVNRPGDNQRDEIRKGSLARKVTSDFWDKKKSGDMGSGKERKQSTETYLATCYFSIAGQIREFEPALLVAVLAMSSITPSRDYRRESKQREESEKKGRTPRIRWI